MYLKANPPLSSNGMTFYSDDETKRVVEIINNGFANIKINKVLVNGKKAKKVELGASRTSHLVIGGGLDRDPYITFHNIIELEVQPALSPEEERRLSEKGDKKIIKHYGLRIVGNEVPETINIKYTYLGIPFSLNIDVTQ